MNLDLTTPLGSVRSVSTSSSQAKGTNSTSFLSTLGLRRCVNIGCNVGYLNNISIQEKQMTNL